MLADQVQHLIAIVAYMAVVIAIGAVFAKRANKDTEAYFLGGRTLGPWVSAFSAEASDMSGWLLMGLPGLAYWTGLASAGWTAIAMTSCYCPVSRAPPWLDVWCRACSRPIC